MKANWFPQPSTLLQTCVFTHCVSAPAPPANSNLDATYDGTAYDFTHTEVDIGSSVLFTCASGMRGDPDWNYTNASAECGDGNVWTPSNITWPICIDSKSILHKYFGYFAGLVEFQGT